jgi:hypothetical protein
LYVADRSSSLDSETVRGRRAAFITLGVVVLAVVVVGGYLLFFRSSSATEGEQRTCAALQDFQDDHLVNANVDVLNADLRRAGQAANLSQNDNLASHVAAARRAMTTYADNRDFTNPAWKTAYSAVVQSYLVCNDLGVHIRPK